MFEDFVELSRGLITFFRCQSCCWLGEKNDDAGSIHGVNVGEANDFQDINVDHVGSTREIQLPSLAGGIVFHVTSTML